MRHTFRNLIAAIALGLAATIAAPGVDAEGLPTRAAAPAAAAEAPPSWSGVYGSVQTGVVAAVADPIYGVDGYSYGGRAGADLQIDRIVLGVLADYNWMHVTAFSTSVDATEWKVGGRAGLLLSSHTLAYGLVARSELDVDGMGKTQGLAIGGGIEAMMHKNWTARLEYLRTTYDDIGGDARSHSVTLGLAYRFPVPAFRP